MKTWRKIRGWLIAALMIGGAVVAAQYTWMRPQPVDVRVYRAQKGVVEQTVSSTKAGSVRSRRVADISVEAAGTVVAIHAREGAAVKKGDKLISIDSRDAVAAESVAQRDLVGAQAAIIEAQARVDDAVRERDRLRKAGTEPPMKLEQAEGLVQVTTAARAVAQTRVDLQQTVLDRAKLAVKKCDVFAPFDGVVATLAVEVGEWAVPGKPGLRLLDPNDLYIRAELDEVDLESIETGRPVRVTLDPYRDRKLSGRIARIAPFVSEAQEQNRTVLIEVELTKDIDGVKIKHGISADVEVILSSKPDVLRVPTLALLEGKRVLVVGPEGRAVSAPVKIGIRNWEFAQVLEGLSEGQQVIVSLESEKVKEGVLVRVDQESAR